MYFGGLKAVDDLSFTIEKNQIVGLIGPNGAGKTTVFNCVTQFYKNYEGRVLYSTEDGEALDLRTIDVTKIVRLGIARTFQNLELIPDATVIDNVLIGAAQDVKTNLFDHLVRTPRTRQQNRELRERAIEILEFLNIALLKDMYVLGLPYGVKKKVEIARALIANPKLMILDEPAAGLNEQETQELETLIRKIRDDYGITVLLIEHDMRFVMNLCDIVCAINFGKLLAVDKPAAIQKNPLVQEAYLGKED